MAKVVKDAAYWRQKIRKADEDIRQSAWDSGEAECDMMEAEEQLRLAQNRKARAEAALRRLRKQKK